MKIDHVHFYVEDAKASRNWFVQKLGFKQAGGVSHTSEVAKVAPSTWSYFAAHATKLVAEFLHHPPGVADIVFRRSGSSNVGRSRTVPKSQPPASNTHREDASGAKLRPGVPLRIL